MADFRIAKDIPAWLPAFRFTSADSDHCGPNHSSHAGLQFFAAVEIGSERLGACMPQRTVGQSNLFVFKSDARQFQLSQLTDYLIIADIGVITGQFPMSVLIRSWRREDPLRCI